MKSTPQIYFLTQIYDNTCFRQALVMSLRSFAPDQVSFVVDVGGNGNAGV
jgi:hypothetical protein